MCTKPTLAANPGNVLSDLEVVPQMIYKAIDLPQESAIQDVFRHIANDVDRTAAISKEIIATFDQGRKVLVLTERTEHLDAILSALDSKLPPLFVLHGRI